MLTQRADEIIRQVFAFVDISTDFTYPTFFAVCIRSGLNVFLIICVGHSIQIGKHTRLGHGADEDTVAAQINVLFNLQGEESIDIAMQEAFLQTYLLQHRSGNRSFQKQRRVHLQTDSSRS